MARIGMKHPVWAPLLAETPGQMPLYGKGLVIGAAVAGTITIQRNNAELYADDALKESDNSISGGTVSIEVDGVSKEGRIAILGNAENEDDSVDTTGDSSPYGGYGYIEEVSINNVKSYSGIWVFKTMMGQNTISSQTRGQSTSFATTTLDGTMSAVVPAEDMKNRFIRRKDFDTLEAAIAWLDELANIGAAAA